MSVSILSALNPGDSIASLERTLQETQEYKSRLELLYEVGKRVGSASQMSRLVEQITRMTQHSLNASASSILLLDDQKQELVFEVAEGEAGKHLKRIRLSDQSGIAGWVVTLPSE